MSTAILALLSVGIGFAIGATPFVQEHLHWNLWFVIPISGLLFGAGLAWLQFMSSYALGNHVNKKTATVFCVSAVVAYFATEIGTYLTLSVPISGVEGVPDGDYKISSFWSFYDYMSYRLGSSTISSMKGHGSFEMGAAGTSVSFVVDLLGAAIGAFGTFLTLIPLYPFCARCACYKKRHHLYKIQPKAGEATLGSVLTSIAEVCQKQDHRGLVKLLASLERDHQDKKSHIQISADERFCPKCREATVVGKVLKQQGNDWKELSELAFGTTSGVGVHGT